MSFLLFVVVVHYMLFVMSLLLSSNAVELRGKTRLQNESLCVKLKVR